MPSRCSLLIQQCYPTLLKHLLFGWKILKYTHKVWAFDVFKSSIWTQKCNKTHKSFALLVTVTVSSNCLIIVCLSFAKRQHFLSRGECWNVAFSASGTIQIKWNKDWLWRHGSYMMIWGSSYDDMMILIWFHGDDRRLLKWYVFRKYLVVMVTNLKHRTNCECCPGHYLIVNH